MHKNQDHTANSKPLDDREESKHAFLIFQA